MSMIYVITYVIGDDKLIYERNKSSKQDIGDLYKAD